MSYPFGEHRQGRCSARLRGGLEDAEGGLPVDVGLEERERARGIERLAPEGGRELEDALHRPGRQKAEEVSQVALSIVARVAQHIRVSTRPCAPHRPTKPTLSASPSPPPPRRPLTTSPVSCLVPLLLRRREGVEE